MKAALVAVLVSGLALADDAPKRVVLELKGGQVYTVDDRVIETERGGCYLDAKTCVSVGKEVASLRVENAELRENVGVPVVLVAVGMVLAVGSGFVVAKVAR